VMRQKHFPKRCHFAIVRLTSAVSRREHPIVV
jgi:hypothetical protein